MAPKPDVEATFRWAVANGTLSLSIIRKGRILHLEGVQYKDSLLKDGDWVEVRTTDDGSYWWGWYVDGHLQLRAWRRKDEDEYPSE